MGPLQRLGQSEWNYSPAGVVGWGYSYADTDTYANTYSATQAQAQA